MVGEAETNQISVKNYCYWAKWLSNSSWRNKMKKIELGNGDVMWINPDFVCAVGLVKDDPEGVILGRAAIRMHDGAVLIVKGSADALAVDLAK